MAEKKIMDIEEELKIVGANMQTLEMSEEKTMKREEGLQEEILELRYLDHNDDKKGRSQENGDKVEIFQGETRVKVFGWWRIKRSDFWSVSGS